VAVFPNGHLPGGPYPDVMNDMSDVEVVTDFEKSSPGVTVTKITKRRPPPVEDDAASKKSDGSGSGSDSTMLQSFALGKRGEFVVKAYALDSSVSSP
jgi:hypothetical protein